MIIMEPWRQDYALHSNHYDQIFADCMMDTREDVEDFENYIAQIVGRKYAIGMASATDALHFSLEANGIGPTDEVLVTNFSWLSTATCIKMVGAIPVFCDIDLDTYHATLDSFKRMKTDSTKAVIWTPLFGNMVDTAELEQWCKDENLILIEDSAQAWGASFRDKKAGTLGHISSFSFNTNKVVASPVGGGIALTDDGELANKLKKLRRHGNGEIVGRNSRMYRLAAKTIQFRIELEKTNKIRRQEIAKLFDASFKELDISLQHVPDQTDHNYHKYTLRFENKEHRSFVEQALYHAEIESKVHYPLQLSDNPMFKSVYKDETPNSELVANTILSIPNHALLSDEEVDKIINVIWANA